MGAVKLAAVIFGRAVGLEVGGRVAGADKGSAGEANSVAASDSDRIGESNRVAESESESAGAANLVAASESDGRRKTEESMPGGGVSTALPTSFSGDLAAGDRGRDSGEGIGFFGSRDGSLGVSNRHLYNRPCKATENDAAKFTPRATLPVAGSG
jgi:hypothetical protein